MGRGMVNIKTQRENFAFLQKTKQKNNPEKKIQRRKISEEIYF